MNNLSETSLSFHDAIGNIEATTQSRQEQDNLQRINIVRDDHQRRFFVLNQLGDVVDAETNAVRTLSNSLRLALFALLGTLLQTILLGRIGFRTVLVEQAEDSAS
jgi:hypothetical protein